MNLRPLTKTEELAVAFLPPDMWPGVEGRLHREGLAERQRQRAAEIAAHLHSWDPLRDTCLRCGTCRVAHEAAKIREPLGARCVPMLRSEASP